MEVLLEDKDGFNTAVRTAAQTLRSTGTVIFRGRDEGIPLVKQATDLLQLHLRGVTNFLLSQSHREVTRQLSLPIIPHSGQKSTIRAEVLQDLEDLLESDKENGEANEVEESAEVMVTEDVAEAATAAFRVLSSAGKVTISGVDAGIPNVALVLEQVKAKFLQPPETLNTKISITIALPGYQSSTAMPEEDQSNSDASSSSEEEEVKRPPQCKGQSRYVKLVPPPLSDYPSSGEFYITIRKPVKIYVTEAVQWFRSEGNTMLVLKGIGWAVNNTVLVAELIKRAVGGLHQIATYGKIIVTDTYEPTEFGLDTVVIQRSIPNLSICLSLRPLDRSNSGYQPPISSDLVHAQ
jgi:DNA-binding protein